MSPSPMCLFSKKTLEGKWCNSRGEVSSDSWRGSFFIVLWSANSNQTQSQCAVRGALITNPSPPCISYRLSVCQDIWERNVPIWEKLTRSLIQQRKVCHFLIVYWLWRQRDYLEKITQGDVGGGSRDGGDTTWNKKTGKDRLDFLMR